jgi:hypothetical protein
MFVIKHLVGRIVLRIIIPYIVGSGHMSAMFVIKHSVGRII